MKKIAVKEFVEMLQKLDPDLTLVISDYDGGDHCERFVTDVKIKNRNQVAFSRDWDGNKLVDVYTPGVKERFAHIVWQ